MKTLIIGAGRMGRRHIQVVRELGLNLAGICDLNQEALNLAKAEYGLADELLFTDAHSMLKKISPDCVIVATTAPTHCEYTCLAVAAGAECVFCEKPMAVSLAECDRMIDMCARHGSKLAVNHQMRFMEQYREPKRIVQSEEFGGLSSITVIAGNFGVAMNGTHYFEMFRYLSEETPVEVTAWFSPGKVPNPRGDQFEDRAGAVRLVSTRGKRFYMEVGADQGHGVQVIYAGPYGQLTVDELAGKMRLIIREDQYRDLPTTRYGMPSWEKNYRITPADVIAPSRSVLDALIRNDDYPSGEDGRLAVSVLVAAYVSHEDGHRPVSINDDVLPTTLVFPWA